MADKEPETTFPQPRANPFLLGQEAAEAELLALQLAIAQKTLDDAKAAHAAAETRVAETTAAALAAAAKAAETEAALPELRTAESNARTALERARIAQEQAAEAETLSPPPLPETEPDRAPDPAPGRRLAGDGLSRFVSRRIAPDESIHAAWQRSLREASAGGRKRNPDSPPSVFRSPSG